MKKELIYIYNMNQAKFILKETQAKYLYKIGFGNKGDILITFIKNKNIIEAINKWNNR